MVKLYVRAIKAGTKTFDQVPALWSAKVKAAFKAEVAAGTITEDEYKEYIGEDYEA